MCGRVHGLIKFKLACGGCCVVYHFLCLFALCMSECIYFSVPNKLTETDLFFTTGAMCYVQYAPPDKACMHKDNSSSTNKIHSSSDHSSRLNTSRILTIPGHWTEFSLSMAHTCPMHMHAWYRVCTYNSCASLPVRLN